MLNKPSEDSSWVEYYKAISGRPPRDLFLAVLDSFEPRQAQGARLCAVDLGCGDGTETLALLDKGWEVLAVDQQPEAIALLRSRVPPAAQNRLDTQLATFEEVVLPAVDLVYAGLSLPFCTPASFPSVWAKVTAAIRPHGRFAGHLFGDRDDWAQEAGMTFFSAEQARLLFDHFEIERFHEIDQDGQTVTQGPKHWHVFEIIARKTS